VVAILVLLAALCALGAWWLLDPVGRIERLCYSVDQVVDLPPRPTG
jgi:HAMP domain-containing protein